MSKMANIKQVLGKAVKNKTVLIWTTAIILVVTAGILSWNVYRDKRAGESYLELRELVNTHMSSNTYIQVHVNEEEFVSFLYNDKKEAFAQSKSGGLAVYRNDDKYVAFGEAVTIDYGISPLRMMDLALNLVRDGKASIERPDSTEAEELAKLRTYLISIKGKDNVRELYSQINKEYADKMVESLYGTVYPKDSELQITIVIGDNKAFGASCHMVLSGDRYLSWYFDGYLKMFDWSLKKDWYSNDINDTEKWKGLINELVDDVEIKTKEYAESNNIDLNNIGNLGGEETAAPVEHDHDGDGISDHADEEYLDNEQVNGLEHDHDGDGVNDHLPEEHANSEAESKDK